MQFQGFAAAALFQLFLCDRVRIEAVGVGVVANSLSPRIVLAYLIGKVTVEEGLVCEEDVVEQIPDNESGAKSGQLR